MQATCLISHSALPVGYGTRASASHHVPLINDIWCVARGAFKACAKKQENLYSKQNGGDCSGETKRTEQVLFLCQVVRGESQHQGSVLLCARSQEQIHWFWLPHLSESHGDSNMTDCNACFLLVRSTVKRKLTIANHSSVYKSIRGAIEGTKQAMR
ncbi:hypothetical protein GH5_01158 [Leishmania sp. Ghana 2012 LV757]|uniref:hypothetical protein n=1 Tax=Leishmania sp. Ghana 2012 LV757 TaxID=2803181 RepID=UPI001B55F04A|nr:hypothetical protein GH5_01158 [Leishmania sp. Ghana 2012 LV757]